MKSQGFIVQIYKKIFYNHSESPAKKIQLESSKKTTARARQKLLERINYDRTPGKLSIPVVELMNDGNHITSILPS